MCDRRPVGSDPIEGEYMSSVAAKEAFDLLNAATKQEFRGWGDTQTAARDRAARKAGVTPAQAERVWKHWRTMTTVNGDVYRCLRNAYEGICTKIENAAASMEREAHEIEARHAVIEGHSSLAGGMAQASKGAQRRET